MFAAIAAVLMFAHRVAADKTECDDNICVKVQGQSGAFSVYSVAAGAGDENKVEIKMAEISEIDADGNKVKNTGALADRHSFNNFAVLDFVISPLESAEIDNVTYSKLTFNAEIGNVGAISVDTLIVKSQGSAGPNGTWTVAPGDLKWNIVFQEWKFCGGEAGDVSCGSETGAYVDFDIEVKGKGTPSGIDDSTFDLGGDVLLELTSAYTDTGADPQEKTMPAGYPKFQTKGSKQVFTFRFSKFTDMVNYDPLLTTSPERTATTTPGGAAGLGHGFALFLMCFFVTFIGSQCE